MNWLEIKALNDLYRNGEVRLNNTLLRSSELIFLERSCGALRFASKTIVRLPGFELLYERNYLGKYQKYLALLQKYDLLRPQTRFEAKDMDILIGIDDGLESGELTEVRDQIVSSEESIRGVSAMFFKHEKYLDLKAPLVEALKRLLGVRAFADDKDQQYIYRLDCREPKAIVLCENLDFLRKPSRPRAAQIELWYAGGKNVDKLYYADTRGLPIYYSCDWDYDGLLIIYPLVRHIIPHINLLAPNAAAKSIVKTEHDSLWDPSRLEDVFYRELFTTQEWERILGLVRNDEWIIEESNDLIKMLAESRS